MRVTCSNHLGHGSTNETTKVNKWGNTFSYSSFFLFFWSLNTLFLQANFVLLPAKDKLMCRLNNGGDYDIPTSFLLQICPTLSCKMDLKTVVYTLIWQPNSCLELPFLQWLLLCLLLSFTQLLISTLREQLKFCLWLFQWKTTHQWRKLNTKVIATKMVITVNYLAARSKHSSYWNCEIHFVTEQSGRGLGRLCPAPLTTQPLLNPYIT